MMNRFEQEEVFKTDVFGSRGINFFLGAGFSLEAADCQGKKFPTGKELLEELKENFSSCKNSSKLTWAASILERGLEAEKFKHFLTKRFEVGTFDEKYLNLLELNTKSVFTTNIDDLPYKIWGEDNEDNKKCYLYDNLWNKGTTDDKNSIGYFPIHGSVRRGNEEYLFSMHKILGAKDYRELKAISEEDAIIFWGWNFEDPDVIKQILNEDINKNTHRWAVVYNPQEDGIVDWLRTEGFNIIEADTKGMLDYISKIVSEHRSQTTYTQNACNNILKEYSMPENIKIPLERVFTTCYSDWENVKKGMLPRMHFFKLVEEAIAKGDNVIVYGMACSGKTTLMRQLFFGCMPTYYKHFLEAPNKEAAQLYVKRLHSQKALLFVDDCLSDVDAFCYLCENKNIQVIGFTRDVNYERQQHKLTYIKKEEININYLEDTDVRSIYNAIPASIKKDHISHGIKKDMTMISVLYSCINRAFNFKFIQRLYKQEPDVAKALVLICYCHANGVPASFDLLNSFFAKNDYRYTLDVIDKIGKLIAEYDAKNDAVLLRFYGNQNYYQARSAFLASKILSSLSKEGDLLKETLITFAKNVPAFKICNFNRFKRTAFDAKFIKDVFFKKEQKTDNGMGELFYNLVSQYDESEYLYQQAALYFADESIADYDKAYDWITKARKIDKMDRNTIKMTEAMILFNANLCAVKKHPDRAMSELIDSLANMKNACEDDLRGHIHYVDYSYYAIKFWKMRLNDHEAEFHLKKSKEFILDQRNGKMWKAFKTKKRIEKNLNEIDEILSKYYNY